ncbi:MAG: hypothetical protein Unbinned706contig1001_1 [Prokaryotic dsDNA virus sp.]|nr:MAG: hypothetical protein Unbinned706contig1001_1 [Prokaryotic dsDNA virus sp.]|tara:strand:- start:2892 stop:4436 length:1545 start_codon:yes stop_codon:yes gene_type:complete
MPIIRETTKLKVIPSGVNPTYNETIIVLESPNIISDNFKWIFELYKGEPTDSDYKLISTLIILPNPEGFGIVDVHRHVENYISTDFDPYIIDGIIRPIDKSGLKWSFKLTEQFENPRWRYVDYNSIAGSVGYTTAIGPPPSWGYPYGTNTPHPFIVTDRVEIVQDPGFTYPQYNFADVAINIIQDDYTIVLAEPYVGSGPADPGTITLIGGGIREIEQDYTDTTFYSFNGVLSFKGFRNWDADDYEMSSTSPDTTKFLTNIPRTYDVTLNDRVWLNGLQSATSNPVVLGYITTNNGTFGVNNQYSSTGQFFQVQHKIGPKDLMETTDTTLAVLSGSFPVVDANTTFITYIQSKLPTGTAVSETITLNIVDKCSKYEKIRFFFMDKLGSYIPLTFDRVSKSNINNSRSNYKQNYGTYNSVSETWGYNTHDRGTTTYDLVSTESVTCTSDWLEENEVNMVIEMLNSPNVYIQDDNGDYIAITITTNSFEKKKKVNTKLINYTITFNYSQNSGSQRG